MYSPWLVPYFPQNTQNAPANWIKQVMSNNQILLPWSDLHMDTAQKFLHTFVDCVKYMLDTLPASDTILGHIFYWYSIHFGCVAVPRHVLMPQHAALTLLPWNRLKPTPVHINCFVNILQQFLPECHAFTGHVFLRVAWTPWLHHNIETWDYTTRQTMLSALLSTFVKLSYEPKVRENIHLQAVLQEAMTYPWQLLQYQGIEAVFEWFVTSSEPSVILQMRSEHSAVDTSILK